ncbi:putative inorganic phosphate cotransporter [Anopheles stephensi]|uniref:putative inorganic phosphate cotransporter n=1 Tax=Anopheles stephensi TaxID=30069 RepID=UPI00165896D0|nr:putative inorganic phosphate cotransporter [Anopheles stephensi]XP_035899093.1 putative inorganic phosphate cotransporter [Anopheles stephensi]XP_035899095.1 putative inorganic phosphate cotransporter [Anopheles stephensi]XP_035899096.1 putative inorganic phosphate cotransporter [Anopheles stephensi]
MIVTTNVLKGTFPKRMIVTIMIFVACTASFMLRVHMSINLLAMVQPITAPSSNSSLTVPNAPTSLSSTPNGTANATSDGDLIVPAPVVPDYGPRYGWNQNMQSHILGAYFYGYLLTSLPAGPLAERYGPQRLIGYSFLLSAVVTALFPLFAAIDVWIVIAGRFLIGLLSGCVYPTLHNVISRWIPPNEKSKAVACIAGGSTFGTVITWPFAGLLTEHFGWVYAFYVPAFLSALVGGVWFWLVADSPAEHKTITKEERDLIEASFGNTVSKTKAKPPLLKVITSLPFIALVLSHYSSFWGLNFFVTQAPKFISEVLGFNLTNAGFLSSLPYLARMFSGFFFGYIGDWLRRKEIMAVTALRKSFIVFSHFLPGAFLIALPFIGQDPIVTVSCIIACLGFNGASTITNLVNAQDLAPNFAATLYGMMNFLATTAGFLAPMAVAYFTKEKNTMEEWKYVFLLTAGFYIVSGIVFIIFGSGKVQKWNEIKEQPTGEAVVEPEDRSVKL